MSLRKYWRGLGRNVVGLGWALLFSSLVLAAPPNISATDKAAVASELLAKMNAGSMVLVSVGLDAGVGFSGETYFQQASRNDRVQQEVTKSLPPGAFKEKRRFRFAPFMSMWVNEHALRALAAHNKVLSLSEIVPEPPLLSSSTTIIRAQTAWAAGATGAGQTIAILDTGVQGSHPFLAGKVVSEACYSTQQGTVTTACPNGTTAQVGAGAGVPLPSNVAGYYHGTHVAGIAAGGSGSNVSGVAPGAQIISLQVFAIETNSTTCASWGLASPCALSYTDDQVAALQHVYELSTQFSIAAASMSLGGGGYTSNCDSGEPLRKTAIDNLRAINIPTTISSGNSGYIDKISAPACISSAISVGATDKSDTVASYSNSASFLSLLAPGSSIYSSMPGGTYGYLSGTSMAAPHVAGAFAVLKGAHPNATLAQIESALKSTGASITDTKNGIAKPRIDVYSADNALTARKDVSFLIPIITMIMN